MGLSQFRGGRTRKPSPPPKQSEAYTQGLHLARHLGKLHGNGYAEDFHKGMSGGMTYRGPPLLKRGGVNTGAYEGEGKLTITHGGGDDEMEGSGPISSILGMFGLGDGEQSESDEEKSMEKKGGRAKRVKKPLLEGDGRLARAKIVRKVMADKGCSMIEASKYVKEHNLYKK
jgi:hypothetical protein